MATCAADADHCCYIEGVCRFLRDDGPGAARRWVCTLRERLGSWVAVHADSGYLRHVAPTMRRFDLPDCGDWPGPGRTCDACGVTG